MLSSDKSFLARKSIKSSSKRSFLTIFLSFIINTTCYWLLFFSLMLAINESVLAVAATKDESKTNSYWLSQDQAFSLLKRIDEHTDDIPQAYLSGTVDVIKNGNSLSTSLLVYPDSLEEKLTISSGTKINPSSSVKECLVSSKFFNQAKAYINHTDEEVYSIDLTSYKNKASFVVVGVIESDVSSIISLSDSLKDDNANYWPIGELTITNFQTLSRDSQKRVAGIYRDIINMNYDYYNANSATKPLYRSLIIFPAVVLIGITFAITLNSIANMVFFSIDKNTPFFGLILSMGGTIDDLKGIVYRESIFLISLGIGFSFLIDLIIDILLQTGFLVDLLNLPLLFLYVPLSYVQLIFGLIMLGLNLLSIKSRMYILSRTSILNYIEGDD